MKKLFSAAAILGSVVIVDYVADKQLDATKYLVDEVVDATGSTWRAGKTFVNSVTNSF